MSQTKRDDKEQSKRFKKAAREHGADDASDIDEVMRRLAAQKRRDGVPKPKNSRPKVKPNKSND